jgi:hypothetical protein
VVGACSSSSNNDSSSNNENSPVDGGQICTDDAGLFPDLGGGTCNGTACGLGCGCALDRNGNAACYCTGVLLPDGEATCISPNCGTISCSQECTCTNPSASACECAVAVDAGGDSETDAGVNQCAAAGGQCLRVPQCVAGQVCVDIAIACPPGYFTADYNQYPCGDVGTMCCLPVRPD